MSATQLDQQESFTIQGPQLKTLGEAESKLPAPARKRPFANVVLGLAIVLAVFGIGGARLKAQQSAVLRQYTATNQYNQSIQNDLAAQADAAASFIRLAGSAWGEDVVEEAQAALDAWNAAASDPSSQYKAGYRLYSAVDGVYNAYVRGHALSHDTRERLEELYATVTSLQAVIDREGAVYNMAALDYNHMVEGFPANLIGALWGAGSVPEFSA